MILFILLMNVVCGCLFYFTLKKRKYTIPERTALLIILYTSGVMSLTITMNVQLLLHLYNYSMFITTLIGLGIGVGFGSIFTRESIIMGYNHGFIGGLMGAMLSAVILNPSLCGLPASYGNSIEKNAFIFSLFSLFLTALSIFTFHVSIVRHPFRSNGRQC